MKRLLVLLLIIINAILIDSVSAEDTDRWKNFACTYSNSSGASATLNVSGAEPNNDISVFANLNYSENGTEKFNESEIYNFNRDFSGSNFVLNWFVANNVEAAKNADDASLVCPKFIVYYYYRCDLYFLWNNWSEDHNEFWVANESSQTDVMIADSKKRTCGLNGGPQAASSSVILKYNNGAIYGTDVAAKALDNAEEMQTVNAEIVDLKAQLAEVEKQLETTPSDATLLAQKASLETQITEKGGTLDELIVKDQLYEQGISDQGLEDSADAVAAQRIKQTITAYTSSVDSELDTSVTGCGIISDDLHTWLTNLLNVIRIGGLVLTLIFGMLDFTKATLSSDKDALKKAQGNFGKRLIAVVLLFIIPAVISFILGISGITIFSTDPFCGLK